MKLSPITLIVLFFGIAQFSISQTTCFEADNNFVFEGSSSARSIAQGDFNNDGEIDIIMGNSLGASPDPTLQRLVYIESTGSGNFAAPVNVLSGSRVYDVEAADLDGDGNLDVVLVNFNMNRAAVLMGNGDGTFQSPVAYTTNAGPTIVQVADINNDTYLDFAIITNSGNVDVFINDGTGVFLPSITTTLAGGSNPKDFALIDINNNGFIDAVTANNGSGSATVLLGDGSGSFTADATYTTGIGASGIVVDYFNGDTYADIAVVNQDANNVSVLINDGSGAFSPAVNYVVDEGPLKVKTGDFDNDGLRDLAIINGISNTMSTLKGNGDGTFASHVAIYAMNSPGDLVVVDLDSDGNDDVVHSCLVGAVMPVYWGLGDGSFKLGNMVDVGNSPRDITTADFDGDGFKDFAVVNYDDNTASVYINDGTGHYSFGYDLATGNNPSSIISGDFNGNTFQDIIVTNYTDGTASVFINTGGVFGAPTTLNVGSAPLKIRKGDFNNDSNLDLFVVNEGNEVTVLPGNGSGAFLTPIVKPTGSGSLPYDIAVGDIDGDGNDDFVVSLSGTNKVSIFKSSGTDFVSTQRNTGSSPYGVAFADLTGDARPEIIVANNGSDNIMVFSNNGTGLFGMFPTTYTSSDTKPISITTGDFNGDGETDVAITHLVSLNSTGNVVFYVGDGTGSLTFDNRHPVGSNPVSIVADDLDNNGSQDLAVVNESGNYVSIMLSMSSTPVITAGGPLTFCGSGSVTLTSSYAAEYLWSNGETTQSITVSAAGNYSVTTSAPGGGCTAVSNVLTVTHLTSPSLSFTGSDEICVGGSTSITVTGADTYQWSDALGTNATQTLSPIADKTYTVVGEMSNGCTDSLDITITVHPLPDADFNTLNPQYCETSGAINLTPNVSGGTFSGPGVSGTIFDPSTAGVGTHSIVYTITDGNGCSNSSSQSVEVTAGGVDATFTSLASQYCEDDAIITLVPNTSGGTFSGDGVTGNTFDPGDANIGVNTITYTVSSGGCSGSTSQNVTVNEMPDADFSGLAAEYCLNDGVVVLNPTTSGGTFTGPGIAGNNFNPSTALVGSHTIEYSVTVNGCTSSSTEAVEVLPLPNASFSGLAATYCVDASSVVLSPVEGGGTFSGPGISGNNFDPNAAGAGTHTITYSVTGANGCSATDSETVTVNPLPNATFTIPNAVYCEDVNTVPLTPVQSGGSFSGPGVTGSNFNPNAAGAGTHTISYVLTVGGCTSNSTESVTVNATPTTSFSGLNPAYCADASSTTLVGSPSGGTFSGPGVTGNTFDPNNAGAGTHTIIYTYTDGNGCPATSSQNTTVNPLPVLSIGGLASDYCITSSSVTLTGSPSGGTFSGPGISGNTFDPGSALEGVHSITYAYTDGNGCSAVTSQNVEVNLESNASFTGLSGPYCSSDDTIIALVPVESGGVFSGNGVTGNNWSPADAVIGNNTIEYEVGSGGCVNSSSVVVEVLASPNPSFTNLDDVYCNNEPDVTLVPVESGGVFTATSGLTANVFHPQIADLGINVITYSINDSNGCSAMSTDTVEIVAVPVSTFSVIDTVFSADLTGGSYTYQWMNCKDKTPIVGETDSVLHVGLNGSYALVTSNGMCSDTSDCVIIYFASLDSYLAENSVKVYPNPNNGHFKIETNFDAKIEIINSVGQLVYLDNKIKGQTEIDLGNEIESGMYIVKLTSKNGASVYRNVVVRN
ncbi:FG-GAP-like repeat-containing protein [Brumimicrobium sp.]|uniref:FG-GAP-like repeat-containing protein n=1 Tax=Brumimicrobium sp. TaxID=2029867 RepID=UPI003A930F3C